jgi:hypothetical protein
MAISQYSLRRLIVAGGFVVAAAAAPAIAAVAVPTAGPSPVAQCPSGEEADSFTGICIPHTVPNSNPTSASNIGSIPGNPLPTVNGIPCTGGNTGQCIGLAESGSGQATVNMPNTTVQQSP